MQLKVEVQDDVNLLRNNGRKQRVLWQDFQFYQICHCEDAQQHFDFHKLTPTSQILLAEYSNNNNKLGCAVRVQPGIIIKIS